MWPSIYESLGLIPSTENKTNKTKQDKTKKDETNPNKSRCNLELERQSGFSPGSPLANCLPLSGSQSAGGDCISQGLHGSYPWVKSQVPSQKLTKGVLRAL